MTNRSGIAFRNICSNLLLQFVVIISGFIMPKLLIGTFGSDVYGLVASITQFLSLIVLLEVGIGPIIKVKLYKYIAEKDNNNLKLVLKEAASFFKKIGRIFIIYVLLLCIIYPFLNSEFDSLFTISLILIMSICTMFEYFFGMVYNLYLQADNKYYIISYIQVISYIINIILVILLIHFGASIFVVKLANTIIFMSRPLFLSYYVRKKLDINFKDAKGKYKIENKFDGLSQHVAFVIYSNTDVALLTMFSNLSLVAIYSVYNMIVTAVKNVVGAFSNGMDSIFGNMSANNEKEVLNRSFGMYEFVYYTILLIIYLSTMVLIVPFIKIYTFGIIDANYIQPLFGILLVLIGLVTSMRVIYSTLVYSVGHFKQTNVVCWVEAISNILISILLIFKYGLVGVALGSLISSLIRLVYFMYYASKNIINRKFFVCLRWLGAVLFQIIIVIVFMNVGIFEYVPDNYLNWVFYAIFVVLIITFIVIVINAVTNYKLFKDVLVFMKEKYISRFKGGKKNG